MLMGNHEKKRIGYRLYIGYRSIISSKKRTVHKFLYENTENVLNMITNILRYIKICINILYQYHN